MIAENHQIAYRNVASKLYNFVPEEIDLAFADFIQILEKYNYTPTGTIFFSIISDPTAEVMTAQIFLPIEEKYFSVPEEEAVLFTSYFLVDNLLMTRIMHDFDIKSQEKYWELFGYAEQKQLTQKTPIFVQMKQMHNSEKSFVEMSLGVL